MTAREVSKVTGQLIARAGWAPILVFILHVFISRVLNGYILYPPLDIPMHFFGGVAMAYFLSACFAALPENAVRSDMRALAQFVFVVGLTTTASTFWEFAEFTSDTLFGTHAQLGLEDTLLDMSLGIAGGTSYVLMSWRQGVLGLVTPLQVTEGSE
jgi:hypothetical protein